MPLIYHWYISFWGVICSLPPFRWTRNNHWFGEVFFYVFLTSKSLFHHWKTWSHSIHVWWYIYLHLPLTSTIHVGKYTSPMDPMGIGFNPNRHLNNIRGVVKFRVRNISWSVSRSTQNFKVKTSKIIFGTHHLPKTTPVDTTKNPPEKNEVNLVVIPGSSRYGCFQK